VPLLACAQPPTANSTTPLPSIQAACGINYTRPGTYNLTFTCALLRALASLLKLLQPLQLHGSSRSSLMRVPPRLAGWLTASQ
jgi:hypothetical protein